MFAILRKRCYMRILRIMKLRIEKWGNSLALCIPAEYLRSVGIKEGDSVEARLTVDGGLAIRPDLRLVRGRQRRPAARAD